MSCFFSFLGLAQLMLDAFPGAEIDAVRSTDSADSAAATTTEGEADSFVDE